MRAHKPRDNFEYFVSGNVYLNNNQYEKGQEYMMRLNYKTRWTAKRNSKISYGFSGMYMYDKEYDFLLWRDDTSGIYKALAEVDYRNVRIVVDPYFSIYDKKNNKHEILARTYFNKPSFDTKTLMQNVDYRFTKRYNEKNMTIVAGVSEQLMWVQVPEYIGDLNKKGNLLAGFFQIDKIYRQKLTLTGGVRFETFLYENTFGVTGTDYKDDNGKRKFYMPGQWRGGLNYKATEKANIRFNIGQAYRFPAFTERFTEYKVGGIPLSITPNVDLKPENGWTSEIGYIQSFRNKKNTYNASLDIAFFWQEYHDMVDYQTTPTVVDGQLGVVLQAQNLSEARIAGFDFSYKNQLSFRKHELGINVGYTYALPVEKDPEWGYGLDKVGNYLGAMFKYMFKPIGGDTASYVLKYRNRHLLTLDLEYVFNKKFTVGFDVRYYSMMENFDKIFLLLPGVGLQKYYDAMPKKGFWVPNLRLFYTHKEKHTFGVMLKNFTNTEYWLRVGKLEAPMNITVQYRIEF
jgi:outer membrane receptor protein involved in Fe transport